MSSSPQPSSPPAAWAERLARWAYATALRLATPLYFLKLWRRGGAEPLYRAHWNERLGFGAPTRHGALWLHAVSMGETRAAAPLIAALRAQQPDLRLLLTHSTATGRETGRELLRECDAQRWLPLDTPGAVRRFLDRHRPAAGVLMETEIWPSLMAEAARRGLPMVLANARLSAKSARQGQRLRILLHPAAARLRLALAQTQDDARRLREAGVGEVRVCGNLKYDLQPDGQVLARGQAWAAAQPQPRRPVLLMAVSREGEEAALLRAWRQWPEAGGVRPLLLIVPRHPQRFDEVATLVREAGFSLARRSAWTGQDLPPPEAWAAEVWLGDSLREMPLYYSLAQLALLGGSFEPLGGQNLIEAAACGCPLLMGPHTFNFSEAATLAEQAGAARRVAGLAEAVALASGLLAEPDALADQAARARDFAAEHRGAAQRMACALLELQPMS
ncbi:3-deoxy-D-manno-octulosonic acid transferase [Mitsuaria sp. WAJ17]|uniref:3-deoxy-D-manno-octulosonic acid transferase n=1 Tax=Mitsuaria sp. WAJ17 TaxID=2761452 RepID=UPI0016008D6F|nr:3-deoxy-D-manno-octulosonic acid transferase [Mitsuaria sp. WAJ17]MBB2486433.1 3-deoxy-D-manno-octulosonic acid transferase [Mitsuaria sp. WAJ17]